VSRSPILTNGGERKKIGEEGNKKENTLKCKMEKRNVPTKPFKKCSHTENAKAIVKPEALIKISRVKKKKGRKQVKRVKTGIGNFLGSTTTRKEKKRQTCCQKTSRGGKKNGKKTKKVFFKKKRKSPKKRGKRKRPRVDRARFLLGRKGQMKI